MYIFKYALKSVSRSIGRNILIGIIVLIIAISSCVAMSIQRASQIASTESMKGMSVSAHIYVDRQYIMNNFSAESSGEEPDFREVLSELKGLELDEMLHYATASSVKDFYYYSTLSVNAEEIAALSSTAGNSNNNSQENPSGPQPGNGMMPGGMQDPDAMLQQMVNQGDFTLEGYVSDAAMEDFTEGLCYITDGKMFEENTAEYQCIITEELATYNSLAVGDEISFVNPNNEEDTFQLTITGIYKNTQVNSSVSNSASSDPANTVITSYAVIESIETTSATLNTDDDENMALISSVTGTYVFEDVEMYDLFEKEVVELGLEEKYTVASNDIAKFEASLLPLQNLKSFATTFLYITLGIGAVVLVVISIISIRDRKYEIGALSAMGMKKLKLSSMFMIETLTVVLAAIIIGSALGSAVSVPVANSLLEAQVEQQISEDKELTDNFGRGVSTPNSKPRGGDVEGEVEYVSSIEFFVDYSIIAKMVLIGIGLSVVSGFTSILFILRYDPKEILANRD